MATFDKNEIQKKVIDIVVDTLKAEPGSVMLETTFESLGADSIDRLEMVMKFEETFGIDISDDDAAKIASVGQAVEAIQTGKSS